MPCSYWIKLGVGLLCVFLQVWALALDPAESRLMVGTAEQQLHVYTVQKPAADAALPLANGHSSPPKKGKKGLKRKAQLEEDLELPGASAPDRGSLAENSNTLQILGKQALHSGTRSQDQPELPCCGIAVLQPLGTDDVNIKVSYIAILQLKISLQIAQDQTWGPAATD